MREVELTGQVGATYDTTPSDGIPTWYRWTGDPGGTTIVQGPITPASTGDAVCVRDPLRPWASLVMGFCATPEALNAAACGTGGDPFVWGGWGAKVRRADAGLFDRFDSETPADVYGRRKNLDTSIRFLTKTDAARRAVADLFSWGGPLQITAPAAYGWEPYTVQPGDLTEGYLSDTIDQRWPHRLWSAPATVVDDGAVGPIQGTVCANWCQVAATWPTYADMTASGGTWLDILEGETQCPTGEPVEAFMDTFSRVVAPGGWGTADTGQPWTVTQGTSADFQVDGTVGRQSHAAVNTLHAITAPYSSPDINMAANWAVSVLPTGDFAYVFYMARVLSTQTFYMARVRITAGTGAIQITLRKRISGTETELASATPGFSYVAGAQYRMRLSIQGTSLRARTWLASTAEPTTWQVSTTDPDLTVPDDIGIRTLTGAALTNPLPITFSFDNLVVTP
ncbi:hypothetical protein ACI2LJ_27835 [Streptomyces sp. NPDC088090]|uniref:hypothetical protein n=1 Tax=Streptomyces sp. NPDC088090 TaxID=3365822 RepID=UPI00384F10E2